jgi:hypothetical protein
MKCCIKCCLSHGETNFFQREVVVHAVKVGEKGVNLVSFIRCCRNWQTVSRCAPSVVAVVTTAEWFCQLIFPKQKQITLFFPFKNYTSSQKVYLCIDGNLQKSKQISNKVEVRIMYG